MTSLSLVSLFTIFLFCCRLLQAQQPYAGQRTTDCMNPDTSNSVLGYTCYGLHTRCRGYVVFRSQPLFNNVTSISNLLSSEPSQIADINEVPRNVTFQTNQMVVVPINCSCSGDHYQRNATYTIRSGDTYFFIANNTFQALSTCQAIQAQQPNIQPTKLIIGSTITVPVRCACPTRNQTDVGINYLLSYPIAQGDTVAGISEMFGADTERTLEANQLSDPSIFFFTSLLVPLQDPPSKITMLPPPPLPPPPLAPPTSPPPSAGYSKTWIYILVGVLGGAALLLVVCIVIFLNKRNKKPDMIVSVLPQRVLRLIMKNHWGKSLWMNLRTSWIKVHGDVSKEIELLNTVNHSNTIRLSGVCFDNGHWYLVYEYAANGALSDWIYNNNNNKSGKYSTWRQRIQIASDIATGLNYLHSLTNHPHVHKDLKCSNVLLDGDFRAKITNFALARSTEGEEGQFALTKHIVGTKGYMAPEYVENGMVSTKIDVYAFGVLLLEGISGKEAAAIYGEEHMKLSEILRNVVQEKDGHEGLKRLIDPGMLDNYPLELAILVFNLINSCLTKEPNARPAMDENVHSLSRILTASPAWESSSTNTSRSQTSSGRY
ncbi:hypothetical protein V6N11_076613 [Hibiscus sabdariffa]|uniref:LysM domain receptor-like kinase 4 n=1 Tax=Hibiscus sabdariffa TaxID=183260 RepID=A0ABR2Q7C5_9ROSI